MLAALTGPRSFGGKMNVIPAFSTLRVTAHVSLHEALGGARDDHALAHHHGGWSSRTPPSQACSAAARASVWRHSTRKRARTGCSVARNRDDRADP
jgi:hypothetical protein